MPKSLSEVARDAAELPEAERLKLARLLLDLSEPGTHRPEEVEDAWEDEIQTRLKELKSGKVKGVPLEQVKQKMQNRFGS